MLGDNLSTFLIIQCWITLRYAESVLPKISMKGLD